MLFNKKRIHLKIPIPLLVTILYLNFAAIFLNFYVINKPYLMESSCIPSLRSNTSENMTSSYLSNYSNNLSPLTPFPRRNNGLNSGCLSRIKSGIQSDYSAWGASSFQYRKNISIDCSKVQADLVNFPVLLVLYDNDLRYHTQIDGDDIIFLDEFNRTLNHEIEYYDVTYNATHACLVAWIRVPFLSGTSNTTISMYYGNSTIINQQNVTGVWNSDYVGVWHMDTGLLDSTSHDRDGTNQGSTVNTGIIGDARRFDGIDDYISLGTWDPGIGFDNYSISAWVRLDTTFNSSSSESMPIFGHYDSSYDNMVFTFSGQDNSHGTNGILYCKVENGGYDYIDSDTTSWLGSTWIYIVATAVPSTNTGIIYNNGVGEGNMTSNDIPNFSTTGNYQIGRIRLDQTGIDEEFKGVIDEIRLSKISYSAEWVMTEYLNQYDPSSFYTIGYTEQRDFNVTLDNFEVIIDTDVYDAIDEYNPGPNVVFINNSHGYVFFQKTNGGRSEIVYYKTSDNGTSWIGPFNIDCGPPQYTFRSFSCWFDQWTPNNFCSKIHFIANSIDNDEMVYNFLDTKDDTSSGNWISVMTSGGSHNAPDGGGTVSVSTEGNIFGISWMTNGPQFAKYDSNWIAITPQYSFLDDDDDHGQLLPLSTGDILCIYEDATDNIFYSFVYDESTDTWDTSPTFITTITTGTDDPEDSYNNNANWGAVLDPNTYNVYLLFNNDIYNSTGDLETWVYFDNNRTWSKRANIVTDVGINGDEVKPAYDSSSNTLFAIYIVGNDIFMKNSTDGGNTWSLTQKISYASEAWIVLRTNFISTERIYAIYFDDNNNDVYGKIIADLPKPLENATIRVNVLDLDNLMVPNAKVTLKNAYNQSITWVHNTTSEGYTNFTSLPYDYYNITVEYKSSTNNTINLLKISSNSTYHLKPMFTITIGVLEYSDSNSPMIQNMYFENRSILFDNASTFFAMVWDESSFVNVTLNLTIINTSNGITLIQGSFIMLKYFDNTYYNATALNGLTHRNVKVEYNIIAIDLVNNSNVSPINIIYLGDTIPPIIIEYNVTDYKNGTLQFYANITDNLSLILDPVILQINEAFVEMHKNNSGLWVYRTEAYYNISLNYTLYSAKDSVGNENGSKLYVLSFPIHTVIPKDNESPFIISIIDTSSSQQNGFVEFLLAIEDGNNYQSGINRSCVELHISRNGINMSYQMDELEEIFYYEVEFEFNDSVDYWISAIDLAGNHIEEMIPISFIMNDTSVPMVSYWKIDLGNGTVDFYAEVNDWPYNESSAYLEFTQEYSPFPWINLSMIKLSNTTFFTRIQNFEYETLNVWYFISAVDAKNNWFKPTIEQASRFTLTDQIKPILSVSILNSTTNDGEIEIVASAIDTYGSTYYINSSFWVNISFSSNYIIKNMTYDEYFDYTIVQTFPFGEQVTIQVFVKDDAGNLGSISKTITISDQAPPKILAYGFINHQNGTITIWSQVEESANGSGFLDNNSAVFINYIYTSPKTVAMRWNGTNNFFCYSLHGFVPGNAFTYNITAIDKMGNINSISWKPVFIDDKTSPKCLDFGLYQSLVNHTSTQVCFWVDVEDAFGFIKNATLMIEYNDGPIPRNWTIEMKFNETCYYTAIDLICNQSYIYRILILDEFLNKAEVNTTVLYTLDFNPTMIIGHNIDYIDSEDNIGEVRIWVEINNTFNDHKATIFVQDITQGLILSNGTSMISNGTMYVYDLSIPYLNYFSYTITISDPGTISGFYNISSLSGMCQMSDNWSPRIHETGIEKLNKSSVLIWANVTDWGSGVSNVFLNYTFNSQGESGGIAAGIQTNSTLMNYNGTYYISILTLSRSGSITWIIEAYDEDNQVDASISEESTYMFLYTTTSSNLSLEIIILVVITTILTLIIPLTSVNIYRKRRNVKYKHIEEFQEKINSLTNIYMLLITTNTGLPVYHVTNISYQSNTSVRDILSGLSVGIDSFLESFQSDFVNYLVETGEGITDDISSENIRTSVIEKNRVQVLIVASLTFRIFVFMKEKPHNFVRKTFISAAKLLQENIVITDLGIVDESLITPVVKEIIKKLFPTDLLSTFYIDISRMKSIETAINRGIKLQYSKSSLKILKRLAFIKSQTQSSIRSGSFQLNLFYEFMERNRIDRIGPLIYSEVLEIALKILKIHPEKIYEALWFGCSPIVDIIKPYEDVSHLLPSL